MYPFTSQTLSIPLVLSLLPAFVACSTIPRSSTSKHHKVLILGGGVTGVLAARTLHNAGVDDFLIIEARDELGGRLKSTTLDNGLTVELGANWIEGIHSGEYWFCIEFVQGCEIDQVYYIDSGKKLTNPIWKLAQKHGLKVETNNWEDLTFYDENGVNTKEFPKAYVLGLLHLCRLVLNPPLKLQPELMIQL